MIIAGEPSGDLLAAELVMALAATPAGTGARWFGAGGPQMAGAGVELAFDMMEHAVVGLWEVVKHYGKFRRLFHQLLELAGERKPEAIICVDFSGFNRRFAHAIRERARAQGGWNPKIIQFVSPQVWASRPGRAQAMARDFDLLLTIFPFETAWYAEHAPGLRVEFVGHPMIDRYTARVNELRNKEAGTTPIVLLLPGSRDSELKRHLPVMLPAVQKILLQKPASVRMVLPNERLRELAQQCLLESAGDQQSPSPPVDIQIGGLAEALAGATLALASTGTVTMECAFFGVPTVTLYKTSWLTYEIGRRLIKVRSLTMPNLLAGEDVFPEFIQHQATPDNLAHAALELLNDEPRRVRIRARLAEIIATLGGPGASRRAAAAIAKLLQGS